MPHTSKLTPKITARRVQYLWGQYRRNNIEKGADIERKIRSNLPVKECDVANLREEFLCYLADRGIYLCEACDCISSCSRYEQDGMTVCGICVDESREAEEI